MRKDLAGIALIDMNIIYYAFQIRESYKHESAQDTEVP